ncbi:MAG: phytanoyl-CoA dioxygenase family protein [candidate division Zixibacteria bacterium]|nr:phytanoyl-CoA dioxygenase family protein [candidate division Zixibacteria bacterium]
MLTETQSAFYQENGYLVLPGLFPEDEIADHRRALFEALRIPWKGSVRLGISYEEQAKDRDPENRLGASFVMQSPLLGDRWFRLALDPRLVVPMIDLLGPDINLHDQKIPLKPPGHVSHQRWHQDWAYEVHDRPELAAILLYLDDTAPDAGATKLAPGTHKMGALPHDRPNARTKSIRDEVIGDRWIQPSMRPGDAIVIHTWLAHSVGDNHTDHTKAMIAHVYKTAQAIDTHGNTRALAELPVARNGRQVLFANW